VHTRTAPAAGVAAAALRALLAERRKEAEAVLGLVQRISSPLDLGTVLQETVAIAAAVTRCHGALIYLLDDAGERLWIRAGVAGYEQWIDRFSLELGRGLTGWTAVNRQPAVIGENPLDDPRYVEVPELNDARFQSALTYPLVSPSDRLVGVLTLHTLAPREFSEDDFTLVGPIASLAAAAVENAQLFAERERQLDVLRSLASAGEGGGARTLHDLAAAAGQLVAAEASLILLRDVRGRWQLAACAAPGADPVRPERLASAALLDPLLDGGGVQALTRRRHAALLGMLDGGAWRPGRGVAAPLRAGEARVGLLLCLGTPGPVPRSAGDLLAVIARQAALERVADELRDEVESRDAARALLEALAAGEEPEAVVSARARRLGCDLSATHVAVALEADGEAAGRADPEAALAAFGAELASRFPGSVYAAHELRATALVRVRDPEALGGRLGAALRAAERRGRVRLAGGASRACAGLAAYPGAFDEAREALRIGRAVHGPGAVVEIDALGAQRYLWTLAQEPARDLHQERLAALLAHDAAHGTQLFATVERYLECGGNRKDAAARLFVHRNTLRQRVERIRRVAAIDLEDASSHFDLQMAARIVRFRRAQAAGGPIPQAGDPQSAARG
jgi:sugar diacid utilization regulator